MKEKRVVRKATWAYWVSAQGPLQPRWYRRSLAQSWQGHDASKNCGAWPGRVPGVCLVLGQCKHILCPFLPFFCYPQAVVTPSYVTRDSECHRVSLSPAVPPWLPLLLGGSVLWGSMSSDGTWTEMRQRRGACLHRSRIPTPFPGPCASISSSV